jgi:hypothetical protein
MSNTAIDDLSQSSTSIAGHVYSRIDGPSEITEPLESDLEANLDRHPSSLHGTRQPFHKSLNIFSIGYTLLEIGLWIGLRQILFKNALCDVQHPKESTRPLPSISEQSFSNPTSAHSTLAANIGKLRQRGDELDRKAKHPLDVMQLKHELILSTSHEHRVGLRNLTSQTFPSNVVGKRVSYPTNFDHLWSYTTQQRDGIIYSY